MKILDELHHEHYQSFEEKFQSAKAENQKKVGTVEDLIGETKLLMGESKAQQTLDKHYIDFKLANPETIDLLLTRAEA